MTRTIKLLLWHGREESCLDAERSERQRMSQKGMKHMKRCLSLLLVFLIVLSVASPAMAEKPISTAYVFCDNDGLPKYWLDFTGNVADNLVLHCYFRTDTWYERYYILDFNSAVQKAHQDTYRIENVYDEKGCDVSDCFKTVSLTVDEDSVRLYMERNPATLAGGTESMLLDGVYEMTPADAGVVYELIEDGQLKSWLVLNTGNAELSFADGRTWNLEKGAAEDYTVNVKRIVSQSGEEVPFRSFALTYVQGAMILNADADGFSGAFLYNPRTFLWRSGCNAKEIARMAQLYYYRHHGFYPPEADAAENEDGSFSVHLYETVDNGDGTYHAATSAWYTVDASGIGTDDIFGDRIDLKL